MHYLAWFLHYFSRSWFVPYLGMVKMEKNGYEKNSLEILHVPFLLV
jgi:hypothetical protein